MSETRPTNEPARHFLKNWWKILISGFVLMFCFSNILSFVKNSTRAYLSSVVLSFDFRRTFIIHFSRRENTFSFPVHKLCSGFSFLFFAFILFSNQSVVVMSTSYRERAIESSCVSKLAGIGTMCTLIYWFISLR